MKQRDIETDFAWVLVVLTVLAILVLGAFVREALSNQPIPY